MKNVNDVLTDKQIAFRLRNEKRLMNMKWNIIKKPLSLPSR